MLQVVLPPHCCVHAGLAGVPRDGRVVLEVNDLLLQKGRDHHLVSAVGGRSAAEDPIGFLEERDVPSSVQGLHDLLAVAIRGPGGQHRFLADPTDRGTAHIVGSVEPPDRRGPSSKHRDGVIERRLVAGPGLQAGDSVRQVMRHALFAGEFKL